MCECGEPTYSYKCELCWSDDHLTKLREKSNVTINNRINELIKQSYVEVPHERDWNATSSVFNKEKFAELIIQECIRQVEQATASPFISLDDANRMSHFVAVTKKKITKHFGVNE